MGRPASFDPPILQAFAEALYRQARWTVFIWTFLGVAFGMVGLISAGARVADILLPKLPAAWQQNRDLTEPIMGLVWFVIVVYVFYSIGKWKAYWLKFHAQHALWMIKLDVNTSRT